MGKEKPIKVEAEVTTKKNVSSGIGKGFGITIGIFLALIVIAVSCGILISSQANKIQEKSNEITANAINQYNQEVKKVEEQIQEYYLSIREQKKNLKTLNLVLLVLLICKMESRFHVMILNMKIKVIGVN